MEMNWGYIAGFLDGEGTVTIRKNGSTRLQWSNTNRNVLEKIKAFIGDGSIYQHNITATQKGEKPCYCLTIGKHNTVLMVAKKIHYHCVIKKRQLKKLMAYIESKSWHNHYALHNISRAELYTSYWIQELSVNQIARNLGVKSCSVIKKMQELGIPRRSLSEAGKFRWLKKRGLPQFSEESRRRMSEFAKKRQRDKKGHFTRMEVLI